jgi:hypothetical protein
MTRWSPRGPRSSLSGDPGGEHLVRDRLPSGTALTPVRGRLALLSSRREGPVRLFPITPAARRPNEFYVMSGACIIEVGEITAGIVVPEPEGFRFFASERAFHSLEGAIFRSVDQAFLAARDLLGRKKAGSRSTGSNPLRSAR